MADEKQGRTIFDFIIERPGVTIAVVCLLLLTTCGGVTGTLYIVNKNGVHLSKGDFNLTVGVLDTISQTAGSLKTLKSLAGQLADNTKDPELKDHFKQIAEKADEMIVYSTSLRDRLLALTHEPDPILQEKLIKEMLVNYGLSQDIVSKIDLGIVSKYAESDSLKRELAESIDAIMKKDKQLRDKDHQLQDKEVELRDKDRELLDKDRQIADLNIDKQKLLNQLAAISEKMHLDSLNNRSTINNQLIKDSLNELLHVNDSIGRVNGNLNQKLSQILPFSIPSGKAELLGVATRKGGEYKILQLRGHDKEVHLVLDSKTNPSYTGKAIPPYLLMITILYKAKGQNPTQKYETSILITPGQVYDNSIALKIPITKGEAFVTASYRNDIVWSWTFTVGPKSERE